MSKITSLVAALAGLALLFSLWGAGSMLKVSSQLGEMRGNVESISERVNPDLTLPAVRPGAVDIRRAATDLPDPIGSRNPRKVVLELETVEVDGLLADGTSYTYWTFNGAVPGPMLRVRTGDLVELHLKNHPSSTAVHSIDLHAVNGPGGGAASTQVKPGEEKSFTFKALSPGLYVYHCASPHIPTHIAMGMYGLILVEPEGGLAPADREFYVMQGELYTSGRSGNKGHHAFDGDKLYREQPDFVVFNGAFQGLTGDRAMQAKTGERIRIFVGNGGPNLISSFHVIGEIFERVHVEGAAETATHVQTTLIPAGGASWVEFTVDVPGRYMLVDHAISRAINKGAVAFIDVTGDEDPGVYQDPKGHPQPGQGGH